MEDATSFSGNSNNVFTTGELLINSGSVPAFRTDQLIYQSPEVEETLVPIFDNTILIDPLLRQQQHQNGQQAVFHEPYKTVVKHNCLNHHPYGTFYYRYVVVVLCMYSFFFKHILKKIPVICLHIFIVVVRSRGCQSIISVA